MVVSQATYHDKTQGLYLTHHRATNPNGSVICEQLRLHNSPNNTCAYGLLHKERGMIHSLGIVPQDLSSSLPPELKQFFTDTENK